MRISLFNGFRDNKPRTWEGDWEGFARDVIGPGPKLYKGDKLNSPSFSPAEYPEGATRDNALVARVWLGVLDYDEISTDDLSALVAQLQGEDPNRFLVYTSYSHTAASPTGRVRVVVDLSRPVTPAEWPGFWVRLASLLPGTADPKCKDPSRLYGLNVTPTPEDGFVQAFDGVPIDVDTILAMEAPTSQRPGGGAPLATTQVIELHHLKEHAKKLGRRTDPESAEMGRWLLAIAEGREYALAGSRHNTALEITRYLERQFPSVPVEDLAELFRGSLQAMAAPDFEPKAELEQLIKDLRGARAHREEAKALAKARAEEAGQQAIREAFSSDRITPYTDAELDAFAKLQGVARSGLNSRWIIQNANSYYFFVDGEYKPPIPESGLLTSAKRDLAPAVTAGIRLEKPSPQGWVRKNKQELLTDYGTVARGAVASLEFQRSHYDPKTQTLYEAVCPRRVLTPAFSPEVDTWLRAMAGSKYDLINLWLKLTPDLREPLAALYLEGPKHTGKSLFMGGVSRLWSEHGPARSEDAAAGFNEVLLKSPVVTADECVPAAWKSTDGLARFREYVSARERSLNRKYVPKIPLIGCVRIILGANNKDLIQSKAMLTQNDRDAIVDRLFHLSTDASAARYLRSLGEERVKDFVRKDEMARHILWLEQNHPAERVGRFGIPPTHSEVHDTLKHSQHITSAVAEWVLSFVLRPAAYHSQAQVELKNRARFTDGDLCIHHEALNSQRHWAIYVSNPDKVPTSQDISKALSELSTRRAKFSGVQYRVIDLEGLINYAEHQELASRDQIMAAVTEALANGK